MAITSEQIFKNIPTLSSSITAGEPGLSREVDKVQLAMAYEDIYDADLSRALVISSGALFTSYSTLDHLESLIKDGKVSSLILTGCSSNIKSSEIYRLCCSYNIPLCCPEDNISPVSVMNSISEYYEKHIQQMEDIIRNHYLELVQLVTLDQGITRIIKESSEILGNPIVITDESYKLVGYSSSGEVDDPVWQRIISNGYCPIDIVKILRYEGFEKQLQKETSPQFLTKGEFSRYIRRLVSEITIGGQLKGYIALLEYEKPITTLDQQILKFVSSIIALEFAKSDAIAKARGNLGQELLRDLVRGNIGSEAMAQNRIKSLDWILGEYMQVILIGNIENRRIGAEYYAPVQSIMMKHLPSSKVSFASNHIVILAAGNAASMLQKALPSLEKFCKSNSLCLGIGRVYKTLMEIPLSYKEGEKALMLATGLKRPGRTHYYEDLAVYDMLSNVKSGHKIHPGLFKLIEYDKNEGTDYIKTLSAYLRCCQNLKRTAEELFLHRNTILYRIRKIEEILQIKLDSHSICLQLELGILLLDMKL